LAAIIWGLKHFPDYLRGCPKFVIRTDHRALTWIKTLNPTFGKLARWLYTVQAEYHFKVEHREGKSHLKADALSRAVASHLISRPLLEQDYLSNISLFLLIQMDNQVQVVDIGQRTLPIHNEETIYFYTRLESVQKRGVTSGGHLSQYLLRIGSKRAPHQHTAVQTRWSCHQSSHHCTV
jgi:hypothetical protein